MARWRPERAIQKDALVRLFGRNGVELVVAIEETNGDFWVGVSERRTRPGAVPLVLEAEAIDALLYLTTRREQDKPRFFKRLDVLYAQLRDVYGLQQPLLVVPTKRRRPASK